VVVLSAHGLITETAAINSAAGNKPASKLENSINLISSLSQSLTVSGALIPLLVDITRLPSLREHDVWIRDGGLYRLTRFSKGIVKPVHRNRDNLSTV
jgi:hypothetical protein